MVSSLLPSSLDALAPPFIRPCHGTLQLRKIITKSDHIHLEIPDEELFDPDFYPLSATEMQELEQVDEINEILAELELMEHQQELHYKLSEKTRELRSNSDEDAEIYNWMTRTTKAKSCSTKQQVHFQDWKASTTSQTRFITSLNQVESRTR
ncbi:unnamed protein product [Peronospora farinosa]|uniref:Uncharacterized protein n=1 Tax=Peronospora farinosa TaxID=134698 RepID=A0AAV0TCL2_9STRA|nr:unnamed protein product [Peronospora farinosa]